MGPERIWDQGVSWDVAQAEARIGENRGSSTRTLLLKSVSDPLPSVPRTNAVRPLLNYPPALYYEKPDSGLTPGPA